MSLTGVYNTLVAAFTASTLETAGRIALGLHVGRLLKVVLNIECKNGDWYVFGGASAACQGFRGEIGGGGLNGGAGR